MLLWFDVSYHLLRNPLVCFPSVCPPTPTCTLRLPCRLPPTTISFPSFTKVCTIKKIFLDVPSLGSCHLLTSISLNVFPLVRTSLFHPLLSWLYHRSASLRYCCWHSPLLSGMSHSCTFPGYLPVSLTVLRTNCASTRNRLTQRFLVSWSTVMVYLSIYCKRTLISKFSDSSLCPF